MTKLPTNKNSLRTSNNRPSLACCLLFESSQIQIAKFLYCLQLNIKGNNGARRQGLLYQFYQRSRLLRRKESLRDVEEEGFARINDRREPL